MHVSIADQVVTGTQRDTRRKADICRRPSKNIERRYKHRRLHIDRACTGKLRDWVCLGNITISIAYQAKTYLDILNISVGISIPYKIDTLNFKHCHIINNHNKKADLGDSSLGPST